MRFLSYTIPLYFYCVIRHVMRDGSICDKQIIFILTKNKKYGADTKVFGNLNSF